MPISSPARGGKAHFHRIYHLEIIIHFIVNSKHIIKVTNCNSGFTPNIFILLLFFNKYKRISFICSVVEGHVYMCVIAFESTCMYVKNDESSFRSRLCLQTCTNKHLCLPTRILHNFLWIENE